MKKTIILGIACIFACGTLSAQPIVKFKTMLVAGLALDSPTSLDFGPDGRLYVAQQNGIIWALEIAKQREGNKDIKYAVRSSEKITTIYKDTLNHDDSGRVASHQGRLTTAILVEGSPDKPVIYVTSGDPLIGGGLQAKQTDTDTNSGILSRLVKEVDGWRRVDLVRGLPKSTENHLSNGMAIYQRGGQRHMLIAQGGFTNKGAPSNAFIGVGETLLSAAILDINLSQLEAMPEYVDPRSSSRYVYDLATLNDPTRADIGNDSKDFPYPKGHPMYTRTIDIGDPFGGGAGLNQSIPEPGGPVQVFAAGFRNPYDVLIRTDGSVFTLDNGANPRWGGLPRIYDKNGRYLGISSEVAYAPERGDYVSNEMSEEGGEGTDNPLHLIANINDFSGSASKAVYYGGHPRPIAAFPGKAELISYDKTRGVWSEKGRYTLAKLLGGVGGYFSDNIGIENFVEDPRQGRHWDGDTSMQGLRVLAVEPQSTNGLAEYKASSFGGSMKGDVLSVAFDGSLIRFKLAVDGKLVAREQLAKGFGAVPLDVVAQSDSDYFPSTIWVLNFVSNSITVFEPTEDKRRDEVGVVKQEKREPILRINAGGGEFHPRDGSLPWLADDAVGARAFVKHSVTSGVPSGFKLPYARRHLSVKNYLRRDEYEAIFSSERWDDSVDPEMQYNIKLPSGSYTVALYLGDGFKLTSKPGSRNFDIYIEGQKVEGEFDISASFGFRSGGRLEYQTQVSDGYLNIRFGNRLQNPLINGIEVLKAGGESNVAEKVGATYTWSKLGENQNYIARHESSFVKAGRGFMLFGGREKPSLVEVYNPDADSWSTVADAPLDFNHSQAIEFNGAVWVLAGFIDNEFPKERSLQSVFRYDIAQDRWFNVADIPEQRRRGAAGVSEYKGKFYVSGGSLAGHNGRYVSFFDEFDPETKKWRVLPDAPRPRDHFQSVVFDDKLYLIGGRLTGGRGGVFAPLVPEVDVYDFIEERWSTLPASASLPYRRAGHSVVLLDEKIWIIGGETQDFASNRVDVFDPKTNMWRREADLNTARHGTQALVVEDKVYIAAGSPRRGRGAIKSIERLDKN